MTAPESGPPLFVMTLDAKTLAEALGSRVADVQIIPFVEGMTYAVEVDPEIVRMRPEILLEMGRPHPITLEPGTIMFVPGRVVAIESPIKESVTSDE